MNTQKNELFLEIDKLNGQILNLNTQIYQLNARKDILNLQRIAELYTQLDEFKEKKKKGKFQIFLII